MDKSNLAEIRKVLRKNDPPIDWIYGFYVSPDNELCWQSFRKFLSFDEDEMFRHKDNIKKAIAGTQGKELFSVSLSSQSEKLFALRHMEEQDDELLDEFTGHIIASYTHTDPYYAMLARITYDVPAISADHKKLEDGDVVYQSLLFAICPAQLSKPALGYNDGEGVMELSRRWTIGAPSEGFLYPSYNDRTGDLNEVLYRAKKDVTSELFNTFFDAGLPVTAAMQKDAFNTLMDSLNVKMEQAAAIQEDLAQLEAENFTVLEKNDAKKLAERIGADTENFDDIFDDIIGDIPLTIPALRENTVTVSTDTATIKIPFDRAQFVKTRVIDGVTYIVIPVDGAVVVNGIPAIAGDLEKIVGHADDVRVVLAEDNVASPGHADDSEDALYSPPWDDIPETAKRNDDTADDFSDTVEGNDDTADDNFDSLTDEIFGV